MRNDFDACKKAYSSLLSVQTLFATKQSRDLDGEKHVGVGERKSVG